jgi:hypothetical protein
MAKQAPRNYQNNPFFIGYDGLVSFFRNAQSVAIYTAITTVSLGFIWFVINVIIQIASEANGTIHETPHAAWQVSAASPIEIVTGVMATFGVIAAFGFIILVIWALLFGVGDYAASQLAQGKKTDLKTSFMVVISRFPSYVWVYVIIVVKVVLWSLLFIVPGIIMATRYSLAGTVFFAEGKHGNEAVKRSVQLTKGAWLTTFASLNLWNMITQGLMTAVVTPGTLGILYAQLRETTDAGQPKPPAHWLSWLTLLAPLALIVIVVGLIIMCAAIITLMRLAP